MNTILIEAAQELCDWVELRIEKINTNIQENPEQKDFWQARLLEAIHLQEKIKSQSSIY